VVLDRARADEQLGADLGIGESVAREPRDLGLLRGRRRAGACGRARCGGGYGRGAPALHAQEIFDQLRAEGRRVGTASVYRALEQLTKDGFVQRIDIGAGTSRFEPILAGGEHHHHLVCDDCGKVEAFADDELERALHKVEGRTGYSVAGHDVVLRGACSNCVPAGSDV
jgi:Fur family transcriptional regulator, ferric uptake regulator